MTAPRLLALALALLCAFGGRAVRAEEPNPSSAELENLYETVGQLEKRIAELESSKSTRSAGGGGGGGGAEWPERLRLSGSADLNYLQASGSSGEYGLYEQSSTQIYDARVFLDANLGSDARLGDVTVYRDAGFTFEWNVVRLGYAQNNIGDLYGDLRGLLGYEWLNLEIGRFQIPYGENYLRFGKGRPTDPFIALTASPPWFWDEGLKLWGKTSNGHFGYVASVTDGEGGLNRENNDSKQVTLKLTWDPSEWMHLSASALRTGSLGSNDSPAFAAVWLGESIPAAFGSNTGVPSFDHGQEIADGPNKLRNVVVLGGDAIFQFPDARLWLAGGNASIDSHGPSMYDRNLIYWLAELTLQLRMITPALAPMYLALRANGLGTYNHDEGYLLDFRYGSSLGYNMRALDAYAVALGLPLGDRIVVKAQYALQNIALVHGIDDPEILESDKDANFFGMEIGVKF
jgi:hypothetical protein